MVLSQETRGDVTGGIDVCKTATDGSKTVLRLILGPGMFDSILEIDIRATGRERGRGKRGGVHMAFQTLCWKGRGDGIRRSR